MSRYVGTGVGEWRSDAYRYRPSVDDRLIARDVAEGIAEARTRNARTGYGAKREVKPEWLVTGFLGELAAFHPIGSGPELEVWENGAGWYGRGDLGRIEVRTTSSWQLYGFALRGKDGAGLGGWRITRKDRGRAIVCVEDRGDDYLVLGWAEANDIPLLAEPLGAILAVVEPPDLRQLLELDVYAEARERANAL